MFFLYFWVTNFYSCIIFKNKGAYLITISPSFSDNSEYCDAEYPFRKQGILFCLFIYIIPPTSGIFGKKRLLVNPRNQLSLWCADSIPWQKVTHSHSLSLRSLKRLKIYTCTKSTLTFPMMVLSLRWDLKLLLSKKIN